jgi:hypothetical protein
MDFGMENIKHHGFAKFNDMFEFFQSRPYHDYSMALKHGNTRFRLVMCTENDNGQFDQAYGAANWQYFIVEHAFDEDAPPKLYFYFFNKNMYSWKASHEKRD